MSERKGHWKLICHGKKERCLTVKGWRMPICARCFGFYSGILIGMIAYSIFRSLFKVAVSPTTLFIITILASLPLIIDGGIQRMSERESCNVTRLVTGVSAGTIVGIDALWMILQ